ncbi:MAG: polymorphic toxin-type HINT domain-containing protein [bacterium]
MLNKSKKILFVLFLCLITNNLFSGLLPDTRVLVDEGVYKRVDELKVGDQLLVYNIPRKKIEKSCKIEEINKKRIKKIVLVETDSELFAFGLKQKVYNRRIKKFIPAEELKAGDKLFSPEKGNLEIRLVEIDDLPDPIDLYEISIEDGNLFLIKSENGTNVLVHNFAIELSILLYPILEKVVEATFVVATVATVKAIDHHFSKKKKSKNKRRTTDGLDDVLIDAKEPPDRGAGGEADVWEKDAGESQSQEDFDKLRDGNDVEYKNTKNGPIQISKTKNGEPIIRRGFSSKKSGNKPTIEIQLGKHDYIKIRYNVK